jgi:hypothetical protein
LQLILAVPVFSTLTGGAITSTDPASLAWREFAEAYGDEADRDRPDWIRTNGLRAFLVGTDAFSTGGANGGEDDWFTAWQNPTATFERWMEVFGHVEVAHEGAPVTFRSLVTAMASDSLIAIAAATRSKARAAPRRRA